jgi:hypothetical protein
MNTLHYREGGREVGEPVRRLEGALVHKRGRKYQHHWLYLQSIKSIKHQLKTTFRDWCLIDIWSMGVEDKKREERSKRRGYDYDPLKNQISNTVL